MAIWYREKSDAEKEDNKVSTVHSTWQGLPVEKPGW